MPTSATNSAISRNAPPTSASEGYRSRRSTSDRASGPSSTSSNRASRSSPTGSATSSPTRAVSNCSPGRPVCSTSRSRTSHVSSSPTTAPANCFPIGTGSQTSSHSSSGSVRARNPSSSSPRSPRWQARTSRNAFTTIAHVPAAPEAWRHPQLGELRLEREVLELPAADGQQLVVLLPADEATAEAVNRMRRPTTRTLRAVN